MVLVGPSGCGKSTLLRMVAGLEEMTRRRDLDRRPRGRRDCRRATATSRWSSRTTRSTRTSRSRRTSATGSGCGRRRRPRSSAACSEVGRMLGLEDLLDRRPGALSGGQRQRVAMGRAIVREPAAFLMDEPLSNLDAKLRVDMRAELARLHERLGVTTIYVTHDQVEAMTLGTARRRDARRHDPAGRHAADALPRAAANLFVAAFIGSPSMNLVEATLADGTVDVRGLPRCRCRGTGARRGPRSGKRDPRHPPAGLRGRRGRRSVGWRRSRSRSPSSRSSARRRTCSSRSTRRRSTRRRCGRRPTTGSAGSCSRPTSARSSPPRWPKAREPRPGERLQLAVDTSRLHFFDPRDEREPGDGGLQG